jgi:uncharacterized protein YjlB
LFGLPLQDAMTAEVHIIARSHGQVTTLLPGERGEALNSVDGGCLTTPAVTPRRRSSSHRTDDPA